MSTLQDALPVIGSAAPAAHADGCPRMSMEGDAPFGAMVAALLARQASASVADSIRKGLREAGLLDPVHLDLAAAPEVQDALAGKVRAFSMRTLGSAKQLARWIVERYEGRAELLAAPDRSTDDLRTELARIRGIGPAGADAILLLALNRPAYPVDRGSYRILVRHSWLDASAGQDEARDLLIHSADGDAGLLSRIADGMDVLASRYCRASGPRCDACPLRPFLPEGGPVGVGDE
jgi:endonuclease III related protein